MSPLTDEFLESTRHGTAKQPARMLSYVIIGMQDVPGQVSGEPFGSPEYPVTQDKIKLALQHIKQLIFVPVNMRRRSSARLGHNFSQAEKAPGIVRTQFESQPFA